MGSGRLPPIWKFRHAPISFRAFWCTFLGTISVTLKWQWKGKGGGGGTRTLPSVHYPPFFPHCPLKKGDRVGKPYPLFHDVKRARFAQRTSPSVLCRKEACMAGVWRGPGREERKGYATFETQIQKIKFYIWKKLDWLRSWPYFECSMKMKTA